MLLYLNHLILKAWQKARMPPCAATAAPALLGKPLTGCWARMQGSAYVQTQEHQWALFSKLKDKINNNKNSDQRLSLICESAQMHTGELNTWAEGELYFVDCFLQSKNLFMKFTDSIQIDDPVCVLLESVTVFSHWSFSPVRFDVFTVPQRDAKGKGFWDCDKQKTRCIRNELHK